MNIELNDEGYTLDGKWKLVPALKATAEMSREMGDGFIESWYKNMIAASPKPTMQDKVGHMKITGRRLGEIKIGGEILPEFNSEKWCKECGAPVPRVHLPNCPSLKSKL